MVNQEWPAEAYAIGSYIQATVADNYLDLLKLNPQDSVLDLGCGNGSYTRKILDRVPLGSVLALDGSVNMLQLAEQVKQDYPQLSLMQGDIHQLPFKNQFDSAVSFWCLQWSTDIKQVFANIYEALKPGGQFFTLFPAGDDPYIMGYYALRDSGEYAQLQGFKPPMDYSNLDNLENKLSSLPFSKLKVERKHTYITLPELEYYRKFVKGIAFYQGQMSEAEVDSLNQALVDIFNKDAQIKYKGELRFEFSIYLVSGEK